MSNKRVIATLGGKPILLRSSIKWSIKEGVQPYQTEMEFTPGDGEALLDSGGPHELIIDAGDKALIVKDLWVLARVPSDDPHIARVRVSDLRWTWDYRHITRRFNIRRKVGTWRTKPDDHNVLERSDVVDKFAYAAYSLRDPESGLAGKWTADAAVENIIDELRASYRELTGREFSFVKDGNFSVRLREIPLEDFKTDERGDSALARILSHIPQAGIYVDYAGKVHIYEKASGRESGVIERVAGGGTSAIRGKGWPELVSHALTRPREVHVLFPREIEVRFDFFENPSNTSAETPDNDARRLDNVLPVPDYTLTKSNGEIVAQGTWVTFDEAIFSTSWASPPGLNLPRLYTSKIREAMVPFVDHWGWLSKIMENDVAANWAARVTAVQSNYRRSFRIRRRWVDRCLDFKPVRTATVDRTSGQRAPAPIYCDYCWIGGQRSLIRDVAQGRNEYSAVFARNETGYPAGGLLDDTVRPAPALLGVADAQQGILFFRFEVDPSRVESVVLPGKMVDDTIPSEDPVSKQIAYNSVTFAQAATGSYPRMAAAWNAAVILTAIPAGPNNNRQLHRVVVKPSDVRDLLPPGLQTGLSNAKGPILEVRVTEEAARIQWSDLPEDVKAIEAAFGIPHELDDSTEEGKQLAERLNKLCVNAGELSDRRYGASLAAIAKGVAARVYAGEVDRWVGTKAGYLDMGVEPAGWCDQVTHEVTPDGAVTTTANFPDDVPRFELGQFLPAVDRTVLYRQVVG